MKYYKLIYDYNRSSKWCFLSFDQAKLPFDRYDLTKCKQLPAETLYCTVEQGRIGDCDYIANNLAWLIISDRVREVFEGCSLCSVQFVEIREQGSGIHIGWLINCLEHYSALDEANSLCKHMPESKMFKRMILRYAILEGKTQGKDFFKIQEDVFPHFISETLYKKLKAVKAIGFDYEKTLAP